MTVKRVLGIAESRSTDGQSAAVARRGEVEVLPSHDALIRTAADRFITTGTEAIEARGRFTVALSGGSTPRDLYVLLATAAYALRLDWSHLHVFWGDERCVPPDNSASNFRMACEAMLDRVPVPKGNLHRIRGEDNPATAAAAYEADLRAIFRTPHGPPRSTLDARFDLILLGLGDDGHTASLFPGLTAVRETCRWVMVEHIAEVPMSRVTLTPVVINAAAEIVFLVSGSEKAATLHRVIDGPFQPHALPAQAIAPWAGRLRWLADADAAADLDAKSPTR